MEDIEYLHTTCTHHQTWNNKHTVNIVLLREGDQFRKFLQTTHVIVSIPFFPVYVAYAIKSGCNMKQIQNICDMCLVLSEVLFPHIFHGKGDISLIVYEAYV